jgi:sugar-specific transcriptional regulator TrmB
MGNTTKQKIFKLFKRTFDYLLERGYEVKFKNISKIIEEIDEVVKKSLEIDKRYIITAKIKMFIDPIHIFTGDYIFSTYNDYAEVDYFKMEKTSMILKLKTKKIWLVRAIFPLNFPLSTFLKRKYLFLLLSL